MRSTGHSKTRGTVPWALDSARRFVPRAAPDRLSTEIASLDSPAIRDTASAPANRPPRALGLADVTLFMVTAGSSLQWTAVAAATGPSSLVVWLFGIVGMFIPLAVAIVSLSAAYPEEGGLCAWTNRAFGPIAGFMSGWTYWSGTVAFLPSVLYFSAGSALLSLSGTGGNASPVYFVCFSSVVILASAFLNVRGLTQARWLNSAGAVARWVGVAVLVSLALAAWWQFGSATAFNRDTLMPAFHLKDVIFWTTLAFAFVGPEAVSFIDSEIKDPRRTIPRALAFAAPMIAAVYVLGTASILVAITPGEASGVYGVVEAIRASAKKLDLEWLIPLGGACVVLDRVGSTCLWLGAVARLPITVGIDRLLPKRLTELHPRYGTPAFTIWVQALIVVVLIILGQSGTSIHGAYNVLVEMMIVSSLVPHLFLFGAAIRLAGRHASQNRDRIPGNRVTIVLTSLIGIVTTLASMAVSFVPPPEELNPLLAIAKIGGLTAVVLLGGAAFYAVGMARRRRALATGRAA